MKGMRRVAAWGLLLSAIWLALSFATYDPVADEGGASNLGGPVGRFLASTLVESFGVGAFVLCFYLAMVGYFVQVRRGMTQIPMRLIGLAVCMLTFGALWQALLPGRAFPGGSAPLGGILGDEIVVRMNDLLGSGFTVAIMAVGGLAGLILATDTLIPDLIRGSGPRLADDARGLRAALARRLEATIGSGAARDEEGDEEDEEARPAKKAKKVAGKAPAKASKAGSGARDDEGKPTSKAAGKKAKAVVEEEEYEEEEELEDDEEWEDEPDEELEDDEEWEYEDEDEEEDGEWADEDVEEEDLEEEEPEPEVAPLPTPKIRQAAAPVNADGIEVIKLKRDPSVKGAEKYDLPPLTLLAEPTYVATRESDTVLQKKAAALEQALQDFKVQARVAEIERGPVITRFDLILERGTKISRVTGLADDLALALGVQRVRIAPVKGKSALGVEIPNKSRETVYLRELAVAEDLTKRKIAIPLFLGKDAAGRPIVEDLATTPHLLIAGRTGAGKSVFVNDLILSILLTRYPEECRLIMIDPKKVELEVYQDIPHLLTKVESSPKKANKILEWAVNQMEERYELLAATGVRHLTSYNKLGKKARREKLLKMYPEDEVDKLPEHMPYIVIIVDELADLMMVSGKEVEQSIARLAQKARAVGIHVVLATQRPSTDVITGLIKSNLPARIAFQTRTGIDSRTILDRYGAEKLLDKGDMLYLSSTSDDPKRVQGPFVSDAEVEAVVDYLKAKAGPMYTQNLEQVQSAGGEVATILDSDELFEQAVDVMFASGMASASGLQRRLKVGYARASRLVDLMADAGIVSEHRGSKPREILMTPEQWEEMRQQARGAAGVS